MRSGGLAAAHEVLQATPEREVAELVARRATEPSEGELRRTAAMAFGVFKAGLAPVMRSEEGERDSCVTELKTALGCHLAPCSAAEAARGLGVAAAGRDRG